jgi:hypothetical protein
MDPDELFKQLANNSQKRAKQFYDTLKKYENVEEEGEEIAVDESDEYNSEEDNDSSNGSDFELEDDEEFYTNDEDVNMFQKNISNKMIS